VTTAEALGCRECDRWERMVAQLETRLDKERCERDLAVCKAGKLQNKLDEVALGSSLRARLLRLEQENERLKTRIADLMEGVPCES